ncbi:MAG: hypothetical protein R3B13_39870 [Polyangiaceae bacterium]
MYVRVGLVAVLSLGLAGACAVVEDGGGSDGETPSERTPSAPDVSEADGSTTADAGPTDASSDAQPLDAGGDGTTTSDATSDAASDVNVTDAPSSDGAKGDAQTCPAASACQGNSRWYYVPGKLFCSWTSEVCKYGCRQIGDLAECATALDPTPCAQGNVKSCTYRFGNLCFDDETTACACVGCTLDACTLTPVYPPPPNTKGRLKLPFKLPSSPPPPPPPPLPLPDPVDSGTGSSDAGGTDAGGADAATPSYWTVKCTP